MVNIKAFIIYIEAYDRSQKLIDSLGEIGVPHEKVLSLSRFKDEETLAMLHRGERLYKHTIGRNLLIPELGASYGHFKAISTFLNSEFEYGIIFDDDSRMYADPSQVLSSLNFTEPVCLSLCQDLSGIPISQKKFPDYRFLHFPSTMTTHAYVLNRSAALEFMRIFRNYGITSVADWPYPLPKVNFAITRDAFYFQEIDERQYSVEIERSKVKTEGTAHALTMPISLVTLLRRIFICREFGFPLLEIVRHEIFLRFKVRRYLAIRKLKRAFGTEGN